MELFDEMGLSKEKKPFNKLAAASPALLALGEKLLSSKPKKIDLFASPPLAYPRTGVKPDVIPVPRCA